MTFLESIRQSEVILIEGEKKVGKFTFSIYECARENKNKILVFSTYNKTIMKKRLEAIKQQHIKNIEPVLKNIELLSLKEEWPEFKAKFGIDFLLKDIYRAIEKINPDSVIFHRFDLFFEHHETGHLKFFMEEIINLKDSKDFKTFFTAAPMETNKGTIENIENFSDINIYIEKLERYRLIQVKNSLFPTFPDKYKFLIKENEIILEPYLDENTSTSTDLAPKKDKYGILIITKNKELQKTLGYVFNRDIFNVDFASHTSEIINKVLTEPDIIIYNPFDKEMDFSVCHTIKENKLKSRLIYITNENYIRGDDKIAAISNGCYEVFPYNFNLLELIAEIEKIVGVNFYTYTLAKITSNRNITNKNMLCQILEILYKEKFFFSVLKLRSKKEIKKEYLRKNDFIFKDKNDTYILILLNTRIVHLPYVMKKFFNDPKEFEIIFAYEAPDYPIKKEEICK